MPPLMPALDFLATRRSHPPKLLRSPAPDGPELAQLLALAARVPDHGKLEPWRFVVLDQTNCQRLGGELDAIGTQAGIAPEKCAKAALTFSASPLIVTVVASPKPSEKIPEIEQTLSVGAVCVSLVNAALASGWGACWLTGWPAFDSTVKSRLGLTGQEWVAGFVHIGTSTAAPSERPRPDIAALTTWAQT